MAETEGVIKFRLHHDEGVCTWPADLDAWRKLLCRLQLMGQQADRYDGLGFGNLSMKTANGFVISGTQTGELEALTSSDCAEVVRWNLDGNELWSRGLCKPSSESLTHAAVYAATAEAYCVFHAHSPDIWQGRLVKDRIEKVIAYGTPAMAHAVGHVVAGSPQSGILVMDGHEDGVLAWGQSLQAAGGQLITALVGSLRPED